MNDDAPLESFMLGIDLGRLRQRLGLLQRRLDGLERGAPASISNTVPHATESAWNSVRPALQDDSFAQKNDEVNRDHIRRILSAQRDLLKGKRPDVDGLLAVAQSLIADIEWRGGLATTVSPTTDSEINRAMFSLELGRVVAFLTGTDEKLQGTAPSLIAASLVADTQLLETMGLPEAVAREQSAAHGEFAAQLIEKTGKFTKNVVDAIAFHHARLDGSGLPPVKGNDHTTETRLLSVAAAYMDHRWPRPDFELADPRRALREVLIEAESGKLDLALAFRLLDVSFYPLGTLVELSGGEWAEVVATQRIASDLELASLPVVRVLRDSDGGQIAEPIFWNLAQRKGCRVVRVLPSASRARAA